ncbi:hypothetical protein FXO38_03288 [Capsicum annuum]|uniref:Putative plant transposon protein domain-containing protein n=1 Tax=Capsicum annuum TaxID=4072 RepID=A0A2G2ZHZ8_CAPAN|nr:hypothetical protein FXO37_19509 [Capsicum annuum]KAF3678358.1 hypothetical protein FXO38_03288 [Capsicum annuum]PHT81564.1 hypothetical protein T459_14579 [Capsicum annuum]
MKIPKKYLPPLSFEVEESEESDAKETTPPDSITSEQTAFKQPQSEHSKSGEPESEHAKFTLITEEKPKWLTNLNERIFKASPTQEARFWWSVVCTHLMPNEGDNILGDDRAILVTILVAKLNLNFGEIIAEEMKIWVSRPKTTYPFPCLIMRLCKAANIPVVTGIDIELPTKKNYNPIQYD